MELKEFMRLIKRLEKFDLIVDVQGDEPLINPNHIDKVVEYHIKNRKTDIVIPNLKVRKNNKNIVKIVSNNKNEIISLSRLDVPFGFNKRVKFLKHLSIVSFKPKALKKFCSHQQTVNEKIENIELFRALDLGMSLKTFELNGDSFSIDVKSDYYKAIKYIKKDKITKSYI